MERLTFTVVVTVALKLCYCSLCDE